MQKWIETPEVGLGEPQIAPPEGSCQHWLRTPCFSKWASTASKRQRERLPKGRGHRNLRPQLGDLQRCLQATRGGESKEESGEVYEDLEKTDERALKADRKEQRGGKTRQLEINEDQT